eukprot:5365069-Alexandrium_andersonii.AAC.1
MDVEVQSAAPMLAITNGPVANRPLSPSPSSAVVAVSRQGWAVLPDLSELLSDSDVDDCAQSSSVPGGGWAVPPFARMPSAQIVFDPASLDDRV